MFYPEAAFVVGYFDSIAEMEKVYDLEVTRAGWKLRR